MKRFRIKDLMVDVLPVDKLEADVDHLELDMCWKYGSCYLAISGCMKYGTWCHGHYTFDACHFIRTNWCTPILTGRIFEQERCFGGSEIPDFDPRELEFDPRELTALREQYRVAIERIDLAEQRIAEQMAPQTVEEIEALEIKFTDALEELAALKENVRKG